MFKKRLQNKLRRTFVDAMTNVNMLPLIFGRHKVNKILMYHGVDVVEEKKFNSRFVGKDNFQQQILYLKKHCNIISLKDFFQQKFHPDKSNIAITFDDGYLNNYKYAVPFLESNKVPATIYVTALNKTSYDVLWPDFLDIVSYFTNETVEVEGVLYRKNIAGKYYSETEKKTLNRVIKEQGNFEFKKKVFAAFDKMAVDFRSKPEYLDYWKLMSDEQLKEVDKGNYVKIESHAYWHNNLGNIPLEEAKKELLDSKNYLEGLLQREISELAYPDGSYTRPLLDVAQQLGYKYQLAADGYLFKEDVNDKRIMDRIGLYPYASWSNQLYDVFA